MLKKIKFSEKICLYKYLFVPLQKVYGTGYTKPRLNFNEVVSKFLIQLHFFILFSVNSYIIYKEYRKVLAQNHRGFLLISLTILLCCKPFYNSISNIGNTIPTFRVVILLIKQTYFLISETIHLLLCSLPNNQSIFPCFSQSTV